MRLPTPFIYPPESIHEREKLRRAGWIFITQPEVGDYVCHYYFTVGNLFGVTVKTGTPDATKVSRWFNKQTREWDQDFFTFRA